MGEDFGVWVYGVTRDLAPQRLPGITGVSGGPLRTVQHADLSAVVSSVDLREYGEEPLRQHLEDLAWLEVTARAHHAVVGAVAQAAPVAPMRLATVYRDESRVAEMLAERGPELWVALERITGRVEFGVKAYQEESAVPAAEAPEPSEAEAARAAPGPGTSYLLRRRADLSARDKGLEAAVAGAQEAHAVLGVLAEASRRHAPQHPRLSGDAAPMVLNGAYLVEAGRADEFVAEVNALVKRLSGVRLELTGPWPPYSFAAVEEAVP